jgi:hypothetical protein
MTEPGNEADDKPGGHHFLGLGNIQLLRRHQVAHHHIQVVGRIIPGEIVLEWKGVELDLARVLWPWLVRERRNEVDALSIR